MKSDEWKTLPKFYKNIYSYNNNICLGVYGNGFLWILILLKIIFSMKNCCEDVFVFVGVFFNVIINLIYFLVLKEVIGMFGGWVKMCRVCRYPFLTWL